MNGYGSHWRPQAVALIPIQTTTKIVWTTRKRAVPKRRAMASEKSPKASGS